jgi:catechol-2,3-dioxygenase
MTTEARPVIQPERLGYILLNVENLERSVEFWTRAVHLEVSDYRNGKVFLRGGMQHHWIALQQAGEAGLGRVGIEMQSREDLDTLEQRLRDAGIDVDSGDGLDNDRVDRYVRFNDPSGNPIELYTDMITMATPPHPQRVELLEVQHIVLNVGSPVEAAEFYTKTLGLKLSDWIERRFAFMHFRNGWHHGIGVANLNGLGKGLNHICFQPPDLDAVMSARSLIQKLKVPITRDVIKHGPSGSIGFYFGGEDAVVEFSYGARNYPPDYDYKPRILPQTRETGDQWEAAMLQEVDAEEIRLVETLREEALALPRG